VPLTGGFGEIRQERWSELPKKGQRSSVSFSVTPGEGGACLGGAVRPISSETASRRARYTRSWLPASPSSSVTQAIAFGVDTWIVTSAASQIALVLREAKG
jgi:hypothetical protein